MEKFNDQRDWFFNKRFGMFIHWGIYSVDARHEQAWQRYAMDGEEYCKLKDRFNPQHFNPDNWIDLAETAGMDYMVFTSKHHDGYCMWDTKETDFNVMNSPYGKDICAELAAACNKRNMPLEWYYSVVDWYQPEYPNIGRHHEINTDPEKHDWDRYMQYLKAQIRELCTNYGTVYGIWWDMNVPEYKDETVHEMIRELQPCAVINNRGFGDGDYSTPERDFDPEGANTDDMAFKRPTEACQSVGVNSWSYRKNEDYFSIRHLMKSIDRTLAMGGNYLLNIGPDADGVIPEQSETILREIGKWYKQVKESFCTPVTGIIDNHDILVTKTSDNVYLHCPEGLISSTLPLDPLTAEPKTVTLLNTGENIDFTLEPIIYHRAKGNQLRLINIPVDRLHNTVPVFKLSY